MSVATKVDPYVWRSALERGDLLDKAAEVAWDLAGYSLKSTVEGDPFQSRILRVEDDMSALAKAFASSKSPLLFGEDFRSLLFDAHADVHLIGQGADGSRTIAEAHALATMEYGKGSQSAPEMDFVLDFVLALDERDPRYFDEDGNVIESEVLRRMRFYQGKLRGSEGWGHVDAKPPSIEIFWTLGQVEDHCEDCPYLAEISPWSKDLLYTTPGACDTPCLFNCKCHLKFSDGDSSARPMDRNLG